MNNPTPESVKDGGHNGSANGPVAIIVALGIFVVALGLMASHFFNQAVSTKRQLDQSQGAASQAQVELGQAKAASAQLHAQLEKATAQQTDLQAQLDQSKDASSHLQSLADEAKAHIADLQAQLDKAQAQVSDLQTQVADDAAGSAALLEQTKTMAASTQAELKKSQDDVSRLQSWFVKGRHLPVTTSFEKVDGGRSFTLHLANLYEQPLDIAIAITGAVGTRSQKSSIDGGATLDVEKLTAGENLVISSDGFDPVTLSVQ